MAKQKKSDAAGVESGGPVAMFTTRDDQEKRYYRMNGSTYYGVPPSGYLPRPDNITSIKPKKSTVPKSANVDKRPTITAKSKFKYDAAYISYVENGEFAAVFITRDVAQDVLTRGRWIDVISLKGQKKLIDVIDRNGQKHQEFRWDFDYFIVELFLRKLRPKYPDNISDEDKKYITWKTAHEDIENQRRNGVNGAKYLIGPKLVNRNQGIGKKPKWEYEILKIKKL